MLASRRYVCTRRQVVFDSNLHLTGCADACKTQSMRFGQAVRLSPFVLSVWLASARFIPRLDNIRGNLVNFNKTFLLLGLNNFFLAPLFVISWKSIDTLPVNKYTWAFLNESRRKGRKSELLSFELGKIPLSTCFVVNPNIFPFSWAKSWHFDGS